MSSAKEHLQNRLIAAQKHRENLRDLKFQHSENNIKLQAEHSKNMQEVRENQKQEIAVLIQKYTDEVKNILVKSTSIEIVPVIYPEANIKPEDTLSISRLVEPEARMQRFVVPAAIPPKNHESTPECVMDMPDTDEFM